MLEHKSYLISPEHFELNVILNVLNVRKKITTLQISLHKWKLWMNFLPHFISILLLLFITWTFYCCWEPAASSGDWQLLRCKLAEIKTLLAKLVYKVWRGKSYVLLAPWREFSRWTFQWGCGGWHPKVH